MPVYQPHSLDHVPSDKLTTESAAWSKQHLKVILAVMLALTLIHESEAQWTHKALLLVEYPIVVDDLLCKDKLGLAGLAHGISQVKYSDMLLPIVVAVCLALVSNPGYLQGFLIHNLSFIISLVLNTGGLCPFVSLNAFPWCLAVIYLDVNVLGFIPISRLCKFIFFCQIEDNDAIVLWLFYNDVILNIFIIL